MDHPTHNQLSSMFEEMHKALTDLENGADIEITSDVGRSRRERTPSVTEMFALCVAATRLGFRGSTRPGGTPASVLDDEGRPMPPLSDPTGELVVADHRIDDPIRIHTESVLRGLSGALGDLRMARGAMIRASKYAEATKPPEPGCSSHERIGSFVPAEDNGRCRWCYDFWLAEGWDPPVELLEARSTGRRITQPMVNEALAKFKKKRKVGAKR